MCFEVQVEAEYYLILQGTPSEEPNMFRILIKCTSVWTCYIPKHCEKNCIFTKILLLKIAISLFQIKLVTFFTTSKQSSDTLFRMQKNG